MHWTETGRRTLQDRSGTGAEGIEQWEAERESGGAPPHAKARILSDFVCCTRASAALNDSRMLASRAIPS